jgi:hypothetical protein
MSNLAQHLIRTLYGHIAIAGAGRHRLGAITVAGPFLAVAALLLPAPLAWSDGMPSPNAVAVSKTTTTSGTWSPVADMGAARQGHRAVVLRTGTVLIIGGNDNDTMPLSSAELFDPRSGVWTPTGSMLGPRSDFTATVLRDGEVLVAGGDTAELYDPRAGTWRATAPLSAHRNGHTATRLLDGTVLVAGGTDGTGGVNASAELYDPRTGTWTPTGSMGTARFLHTATLLHDGRVLVVGGDNTQGTTDTAELYDPHSGGWDPAASLSTPRVQHGAALLRDGSVLVSGGCCFLGSAELYDPHTDTWLPTGDMTATRFGHNPIVLHTGSVLATGGCCQPDGGGFEEPDLVLASVEVYSPRTGTWQAEESMSVARLGHTTTLLRSGQVLVTGGANEIDGVMASAELFTPFPPASQDATSESPSPATADCVGKACGDRPIVGDASH